MSVGDDDQKGHSTWFSTKWAGVVAVSVGVMAAVVAAVAVAAGVPVVNSPMAVADDGTTATPWVPVPAFGPQPVPQARSSVNAQQQKPSTATAVPWVNRATPPFKAIAQAMGLLGPALQASDINGMQAACRQLSTAGAQFGATLPASTPAITDQAQAAVNEINAATSACLGDSPDPATIAAHASQATSDLAAVGKMVSGG